MHNYNHFLKKILLFSIPIWIHIGFYIGYDPFMVIYNYNDFYAERRIPVALDKDYVSTANYLNHIKHTAYDSYIFGNSRSMYYKIEDWQRHIGAHSVCYHFDASDESLYGVLRKLQLIDRLNTPITNALLVIDSRLLQQVSPNTSSHLFYISPQLEGYHNVIDFHLTHWQTMLNPKFAYAVVDYCLTKKVKDYMTANHYFENHWIDYNALTNEVIETEMEQLIAKGCYYTPQRMKVFEHVQNPSEHAPVIHKVQKEMLQEIHRLLQRNKTRVKIIISPLYNQVWLNKSDFQYLRDLFGADCVYDFSGRNAITADFKNYYEADHYRHSVAAQILNKVYQ